MDKDRLQGLWQAVKAEADGHEASESDIKQFQVLVKGDTITFQPDNRSSQFELDEDKLPKTIDLTPKDGPAKEKKLPAGIYALEGGELRICLNNSDTDFRPPEFKTHPGDGMRLLALKRVKDQ